jgi:hypothetical protein
VYKQQQQEQEQQQQDAENPFLNPPFSRIKNQKNLKRLAGGEGGREKEGDL